TPSNVQRFVLGQLRGLRCIIRFASAQRDVLGTSALRSAFSTPKGSDIIAQSIALGMAMTTLLPRAQSKSRPAGAAEACAAPTGRSPGVNYENQQRRAFGEPQNERLDLTQFPSLLRRRTRSGRFRSCCRIEPPESPPAVGVSPRM